jgi:transcriptional regulator with XRE-family HTH domain
VRASRVKKTLAKLAANVRGLREERGLSQADLAERSELDLRQIQRIESGEVNFGVAWFVAIADALGEPLNRFTEQRGYARRGPGRPRKAADLGAQLNAAEPTVTRPKKD